jgi:tetratricopeptide (TPR) repeat protein
MPDPQVRPWLIAGALGFALALGGFGYGIFRKVSSKVAELAEEERSVEKQRSTREAPVVDVAPAPLPSGLPLVEREGTNALGYPRSYVDGPALRSLLEHRKFAELTRSFEQLQARFETDPKNELFPIVAASAFGSALPRLTPLLDAWVDHSPNSFAPYLARGAHRTEVAWSRRGGKWSKDTARSDLKAMRDAAQSALPDLGKALELRPQLFAALRFQVSALQLLGDGEGMRAALETANRLCASCYYVRSRYVSATTPRWGGSYEAMLRSVARVPVSQNPALGLLKGYVDDDRASLAVLAGDLDAALAHANAACELGAHEHFLARRALIHWRRGARERAAPDYDPALELRPDDAGTRIERAGLRADQKKWVDAAEDLLAGLRVDTSSNEGRRLLPRLFQALVAEADGAAARGERDEALRLFDVAESLYPFAREVGAKRAAVVRGGLTGTPEELKSLEEAVAAAPDDYNARLRLDYALAHQNAFERVIEMWTEYLARHPDRAAAYYERGGAFQRLGQLDRATDDFRQACERGHHAACAVAGYYGKR